MKSGPAESATQTWSYGLSGFTYLLAEQSDQRFFTPGLERSFLCCLRKDDTYQFFRRSHPHQKTCADMASNQVTAAKTAPQIKAICRRFRRRE